MTALGVKRRFFFGGGLPLDHRDEAVGGSFVLACDWQFVRYHSLPQFVSAARNLITCCACVNNFAKKFSRDFIRAPGARARDASRARDDACARDHRCFAKASNDAVRMRACAHCAVLRRAFADAIACVRTERSLRKFFSSRKPCARFFRVAQAKLRGIPATRLRGRARLSRILPRDRARSRGIPYAIAAAIAAAKRSRSASFLVSVTHTSSASPSAAYSSPSA